MKYLSNLYDAVDLELILSFKRRGTNREVQSKCGLRYVSPTEVIFSRSERSGSVFPKTFAFPSFSK